MHRGSCQMCNPTTSCCSRLAASDGLSLLMLSTPSTVLHASCTHTHRSAATRSAWLEGLKAACDDVGVLHRCAAYAVAGVGYIE